ncbi:MAG: alpha/beta fold hydrolase [Aliidiomarina sp.]|uniref:alpha/beta fold hydrolase n=1 Tax=Aliidiomarina sp. TaxID=1872439 RepID=UPI0025BF4357|nr:alpha/beta fold hydrolase [Aliidiomarina sp.]MCH8500487.1 alpha/beta fold hydrolase [Aliidiomarina sp.]
MIRIVFAHGAGAGPESDFMQSVAAKLGEKGYKVHTFAFPYWQKVLESGTKRPPDRAVKLDQAMLDQVQALREQFPQDKFVLLGKSMGSRVAFRTADAANARAAIALGFPFHPPKQPDKDRFADLVNTRAANLIIQGTADPFGRPDFVNGHGLPHNVAIQWLADGNHDLVAAKRSGLTQNQSWQQVADWVDEFIQQCC